MAREFQGKIELDVRDSHPDWEAFLPGQGARGRAQRARRAVRRHRPGGMVAVRRADQHAHDGPAGGGRPDVLPVAHHGPLLADPVDVPDRAQPPPERVRHDLGVVDRVPRLQLAHPADERDDGQRAARGGLEHVLGRQEPQRPGRRVDDGRRPRSAGRWARATTGSTASSAARPTTGIPRWPRTTGTSTSPTLPEEGYHLSKDLADQALRMIRDTQADRAGQAVVPVVLPGRQPRAAPRARGVHRQVRGDVRRRL